MTKNYRVVAAVGETSFLEPVYIRRANARFKAIFRHYWANSHPNGLEGLSYVELAYCQYPKVSLLNNAFINATVDSGSQKVQTEKLRFVLVNKGQASSGDISEIKSDLDLLVHIVIDDNASRDCWGVPADGKCMTTIVTPSIELEEIFLSISLDIGTANSKVFQRHLKYFIGHVFPDLAELYKAKVDFASSAELSGIPAIGNGAQYVSLLDRSKIAFGYHIASVENEIARLTRWLKFLTVSYNKKYPNKSDGFYNELVNTFAIPRANVSSALRAALLAEGPSPRFIVLPMVPLIEEEMGSVLFELGKLGAVASRHDLRRKWSKWWGVVPAARMQDAPAILRLCSNGRVRVIPTI